MDSHSDGAKSLHNILKCMGFRNHPLETQVASQFMKTSHSPSRRSISEAVVPTRHMSYHGISVARDFAITNFRHKWPQKLSKPDIPQANVQFQKHSFQPDTCRITSFQRQGISQSPPSDTSGLTTCPNQPFPKQTFNSRSTCRITAFPRHGISQSTPCDTTGLTICPNQPFPKQREAQFHKHSFEPDIRGITAFLSLSLSLSLLCFAPGYGLSLSLSRLLRTRDRRTGAKRETRRESRRQGGQAEDTGTGQGTRGQGTTRGPEALGTGRKQGTRDRGTGDTGTRGRGDNGHGRQGTRGDRADRTIENRRRGQLT